MKSNLGWPRAKENENDFSLSKKPDAVQTFRRVLFSPRATGSLPASGDMEDIAIGKNPAFLFYPSDWTRDMGPYSLEMCGAWITIICSLFWDGGKQTKTIDEWARILREKRKKTEKIFDFFSKKGIADITYLDNQNVTIISRRMVRDFELSQIRREVGKLGGNPGLKKISKNRENLVNQTDNQNDQPSVSVSVSVTKTTPIVPLKGDVSDAAAPPFLAAESLDENSVVSDQVFSGQPIPSVDEKVDENKNEGITPKKKKGNGIFHPPSVEEVTAYCHERGNSVNPEQWWDFYESKGWMVGKNPMKKWQAAVRTWENSGYNNRKKTNYSLDMDAMEPK